MNQFIKKVEASPSFPALELTVTERWKREQTFEQTLEATADKTRWHFYDGPPFPTGNPHHGTIFVSILKDVLPRFKTMQGFFVDRQWGWDCHGLPIETQAEKNLNLENKNDIERKIGVEKFNDECRRIVSFYNESWREYVDAVGRWVRFDEPYQTLDKSYMNSVIWAFSELYKKKLIYKDFRVNPYCYRCQTPLSISDTRMDDSTRPKQDRAVVVAFECIENPQLFFLAWTTTPWTLPANLALGVGSEIEYLILETNGRQLVIAAYALGYLSKELGTDYKIIEKLSGRNLSERELSYRPLFSGFADQNKNGFRLILADFVTTTDGTGIVHLAPAFGEEDYWVCRKNGIKVLSNVDDSGRFTEIVPEFAGRLVHEANTDIIRYLKEKNSIIKNETIEHNYPHCWRCRTPLIYRAVDAWYVNIEAIKSDLLEKNQEISWYPETVKDGRFGKWLENARDWNISRNRYWSTPIPVWICDSCEIIEVLGSAEEIEKKAGRKLPDLHKEHLDKITYSCGCGGKMKRVPEVLDGWFESGSMPFAQFGYPFENKTTFQESFPADFIVEYTGQIRCWFYYLHVLSVALFGQPAFKNCLVHGTLLANDGKKISKSQKNYTDPLTLIRQTSSDAFRAYLLGSAAVELNDLAFKDEGVNDCIRSILLPLWNSLSFFTTYAEIDGISIEQLTKPAIENLTDLDLYILSENENLLFNLTDFLNYFRVQDAMRLFPEFLDVLNNWYIRRSRERVWSSEIDSPDKLAFYSTIYSVLSRVTLCLAPFCPFITEAVWERLGNQTSVHLQPWPKLGAFAINETLSEEIKTVREVIKAGLSVRSREKIRVRQPLSKLELVLDRTIDLERYSKIIEEELNVKSISLLKDYSVIARQVGKVNARKLGPRYGTDVQKIIALCKEGKFIRQPDLTFKVGDFVLSSEDLEITYLGNDGFSVEPFSGGVLAFDVRLTPDLIVEGHARDLVRNIQDLRKEAGYAINDRIKLSLIGGPQALESYFGYIASQTLALTVTTTQLVGERKERSVEIYGATLNIQLSKA